MFLLMHYSYTGYCPQMRFCMGKPYARLTAELLASAEVKHSKCLVLKDHAPDPESDTSPVVKPSNSQVQQTGHVPTAESDSNLKRMIPGYTGTVGSGGQRRN